MSCASPPRKNRPARGQTLADATRQAMGKAQSIAQAMGGRVVRVVEEQEGGTNRPTAEANLATYAAEESRLDARKAMPTPVEAGSLNVKSQVQLVVEIEAKQ